MRLAFLISSPDWNSSYQLLCSIAQGILDMIKQIKHVEFVFLLCGPWSCFPVSVLFVHINRTRNPGPSRKTTQYGLQIDLSQLSLLANSIQNPMTLFAEDLSDLK